ncbi:hypothetical protein [Streptomyces sp. XC 2026]|uniref:hypothetical protein n=1 Tax=Streptomyces sp. XC 2026 TaxID=2782004 RepID=UPI0019089A90|nr:hypothetical protein [Streptomyces sp. XC 2026]QQN79761.1 hypothetical protein IPZ77_21790 [Streptomyces sp. XC 2026]QQN80631.1 hypothetical protein IPZ77_26865 [Streptomyces sp. XC 2026]
MGIRLYVEVLDYAPTTLTHREKLLLAVLAVDANDDTRRTWNSVESDENLRRAQVSRSQLYAVLKKLIEKGALKKVGSGQKNAAAKYELPHMAPLDAKLSVPESGTQTGPQCPETADTDTPSQCPETADTDDSQCPGFRDVSVPESGTPTPNSSKPAEDGSGHRTPGSRYPEQVLPLLHAMSASGLNVRWPFEGNEWFTLIALIKERGVQAMVEHAHRAAANARTPVTSARYFIPGWRELPPAPPEGTPVYRPTAQRPTYTSPEENGIF